jgi:hypothetical protein
MKVFYKGYEITVTKDKCLGGWTQTDYSVFRTADGYECTSGFEDTSDSVRDVIKSLKERVDAELKSCDPWGESAREHVSIYW